MLTLLISVCMTSLEYDLFYRRYELTDWY